MLRFRRYITAILMAGFLFISAMPAKAETGRDYIKWVDFDVSYKALSQAMDYDIKTHESGIHLNWIEMLAFLGAKYGGNFSKYQEKDLNSLAKELKSGKNMQELTDGMKYYEYYHEAYSAVLSGFVGEYKTGSFGDNGEVLWENKYGLKAYHPIAAGFSSSAYDDFGAGRNYGFKRKHLGHDIFGAIGTPIVAVESGIVEVMGWNQYGGWRIGVRSFDGMRYYYYAHLRQNRPFHPDIQEGQIVKAGDVIGYMGHTGYSLKENVNNIRETHLHIGLQLIFDPSQKEGNNEIWIDVYALMQLLQENKSEVYRVAETKEFYRKYNFDEPILHSGLKPLTGAGDKS